MKGNIATGTIKIGDLYYFDHKCYHAFDITFTKTSYTRFCNLIAICAGNEKKDANKYLYNLKRRFKRAGIISGTKVAVLFEDNGDIVAISKTGSNIWISVREKFNRVKFSNLNIKNLKIHI